MVLDASVAVDLLTGTDCAPAASARLAGTELHAPAHLDAEVLSALGRMQRAGDLAAVDVELAIDRLAVMPVTRHPLPNLLTGAWARRAYVRLLDGLYIALAEHLGLRVLTTDLRLARACPELTDTLHRPTEQRDVRHE
ncbi:PIN domain-containing protein [Allosaccharopolyspora coralli]|uniref:Ribonuclease VapC n=1 Tax=Allosaccharopolyspora coralli TaxID=2665642 RepID=A0A5Q3QD36_9PSEU|nr:PIN domain-containing protein [Allosaccharopolyspora coralli]